MSHEHLEIVSRNSIGVAVQGIPSATNGVVDGDVASSKPSAWIEIGKPRVFAGLNRADVGLSAQEVGGALEAYADPAVVE